MLLYVKYESGESNNVVGMKESRILSHSGDEYNSDGLDKCVNWAYLAWNQVSLEF